MSKFQPKRRCSAALTKHDGGGRGKLGGDVTLPQASLEAFFSLQPARLEGKRRTRELSITLWTPFRLPHFCSCQAFIRSMYAISCQRHNEIICIFAHNFHATISNFKALRLGRGGERGMEGEQQKSCIPARGHASWAGSLLLAWNTAEGSPDYWDGSHNPPTQLPAVRVMLCRAKDRPRIGMPHVGEVPRTWGRGKVVSSPGTGEEGTKPSCWHKDPSSLLFLLARPCPAPGDATTARRYLRLGADRFCANDNERQLVSKSIITTFIAFLTFY